MCVYNSTSAHADQYADPTNRYTDQHTNSADSDANQYADPTNRYTDQYACSTDGHTHPHASATDSYAAASCGGGSGVARQQSKWSARCR
jgi:hypothetical protein